MKNMEDNPLTSAITDLLAVMSTMIVVPEISDILIFEMHNEMDGQGRLFVFHNSLVSPDAYEGRFRELVGLGLSWINISCYGFLNNSLIIGIEIPNSIGKPSARTSFNFSGPPLCVLQKDWDAREILSIKR